MPYLLRAEELAQGTEFAPDDLAILSKVKGKIEVIGDYEDTEKVRKLLKDFAKNTEVRGSQ